MICNFKMKKPYSISGPVVCNNDFIAERNSVDRNVKDGNKDNSLENKHNTIEKHMIKIRKIPLHMRPRISGMKKYECPNNCGKFYSNPRNMQRHFRLECGIERQFPCPFCNVKFKRNNHLKSHLMSKHLDKLEKSDCFRID